MSQVMSIIAPIVCEDSQQRYWHELAVRHLPLALAYFQNSSITEANSEWQSLLSQLSESDSTAITNAVSQVASGVVRVPIAICNPEAISVSGFAFSIDTGVCVVLKDTTEECLQQASRDEFFAIATHELRTPLVTIAGCAQLIQASYGTQYPSHEVAEMLHEIQATSDKLLAMVGDYLTMGKLEGGRFTFEMSVVSVLGLVREVVQELQPAAIAMGVSLYLQECPEQPEFAYTDSLRYKQILTNLIGNAIKYAPQAEVVVHLRADQHQATCVVRDTGIGIPLEDQAHIFEKYKQAAGVSAYTLTAGRSSGLGLYITRLLAEGLGGVVALDWSEQGKGSQFSFSVPYVAPES